MKKTSENLNIPRHIAVVMDGNGRWAKKRGLPRQAGHRAGASTFKRICRHANRVGVECMTFYTFSTENWKRPKEEVDAIMKLLVDYLKDVSSFKKENMKLTFIGDRVGLTPEINRLMDNAIEESKDATGMHVVLAINYGGRHELTEGIKKLCREVKDGSLSSDEISDETISASLYTYDLPEPDLLIRTGGEYRLSNFLIWQSVYAELYFTDILWPDFNSKALDAAIADFSSRNRRFGGV